MQKIFVSELTKIAVVHLYSQGYKNEDLVNFELSLTNPSIVYEKQKVETLNEKIGLAIGVTENLTKKYDAVKLVKIGSEIIGGKGGGGRSDFAQAGGIDSSKIDNAIEQIKSLI